MDIQSAEAPSTRAFHLGDFLRDQLRNIAPFITLIVLVAFFSIASPSFASLGNLENILQQVSITAIMAVGLTFVILTAEIDLSVGAIANATAIVLTFFTLQPDYVNIANLPMPGPIAIILALLACGALGLITAFGVTRIGIPSFIMTLAMMQIGAGISAVLVRGQIAYSVPPLILTLGSKTIFGVPWIIIVAALLLLVAHLVLTYTRFGRYVYMVGGNREAAEYSGVNVRFVVGAVMVISAVCSGFAGMVGVAYFGSAQQNEFDTFLLEFDRRRGGRRHEPVRWARRHRQHDRRPVRARRAQQRPRLREDRQLPQDPDPRAHPAHRAHHKRLCRTVAHGAERRASRLNMARRTIWTSALLFAAAGATAAQGAGRVLTTSDVVHIRIVDHPDLDTTTRVEPDGTINFPYVGRIKAAGRTEDDLGRAVEQRLIELKIIAGP